MRKQRRQAGNLFKMRVSLEALRSKPESVEIWCVCHLLTVPNVNERWMEHPQERKKEGGKSWRWWYWRMTKRIPATIYTCQILLKDGKVDAHLSSVSFPQHSLFLIRSLSGRVCFRIFVAAGNSNIYTYKIYVQDGPKRKEKILFVTRLIHLGWFGYLLLLLLVKSCGNFIRCTECKSSVQRGTKGIFHNTRKK